MGSLPLSKVPVPIVLFLLLALLSCSFEKISGGTSDDDLQNDPTEDLPGRRHDPCLKVPRRVLRKVLGSAYNEFYMSVDAPQGSTRSADNGTVVNHHQFFVEEDLEIVLSEEPAWMVDFAEKETNSDWKNNYRYPVISANRHDVPVLNSPESKRSISDPVLNAIALSGDTRFKWHCDAPLRWHDLGKNYFPRYILSADCNHHGCKGVGFQCEPRSFTIKVLRRWDGVCDDFIAHRDTQQFGSQQMPDSLREVWVWEMRAVSFCCVCQYKSNASRQPNPRGG